jgi:hypothetical protein
VREALWEAILREFQQELDALPVLDLCAVNPSFEHQTLGVHQQVALSALDLLATIVSSFISAHPGRFDRLAIYDARARLRVSLEANSHPLAQGSVHPFPGSIHSPETEVMVDGLPGWEVMGQ